MQYGHFDDYKKEYVINTPETPYPWINYLGNKDFFGLVSNTGGGYAFYKDARLMRLTRYRYNDIPVDNGGRYYYIHHEGDIWNPGWKPVKSDYDHYECRHGMGYTRIESEKNKLRASVTMFVPLEYCGEVHMVELENKGDQTMEFSLFSYLEFNLWDALDDMTNFQRNLNTGEVEVDESASHLRMGARRSPSGEQHVTEVDDAPKGREAQ